MSDKQRFRVQSLKGKWFYNPVTGKRVEYKEGDYGIRDTKARAWLVLVHNGNSAKNQPATNRNDANSKMEYLCNTLNDNDNYDANVAGRGYAQSGGKGERRLTPKQRKDKNNAKLKARYKQIMAGLKPLGWTSPNKLKQAIDTGLVTCPVNPSVTSDEIVMLIEKDRKSGKYKSFKSIYLEHGWTSYSQLLTAIKNGIVVCPYNPNH